MRVVAIMIVVLSAIPATSGACEDIVVEIVSAATLLHTSILSNSGSAPESLSLENKLWIHLPNSGLSVENYGFSLVDGSHKWLEVLHIRDGLVMTVDFSSLENSVAELDLEHILAGLTQKYGMPINERRQNLSLTTQNPQGWRSYLADFGTDDSPIRAMAIFDQQASSNKAVVTFRLGRNIQADPIQSELSLRLTPSSVQVDNEAPHSPKAGTKFDFILDPFFATYFNPSYEIVGKIALFSPSTIKLTSSSSDVQFEIDRIEGSFIMIYKEKAHTATFSGRAEKVDFSTGKF